MRASSRIDTSEGAEGAGRGARADRTRTCRNNSYTILCLIQVEPDDEPVLAEDKVRYKGEQIVRGPRRDASARRSKARAEGQGRLRGSAGRSSTSRRR